MPYAKAFNAEPIETDEDGNKEFTLDDINGEIRKISVKFFEQDLPDENFEMRFYTTEGELIYEHRGTINFVSYPKMESNDRYIVVGFVRVSITAGRKIAIKEVAVFY